MRLYYTFTVLCCLVVPALYAQMWNGTDTLYGNEWIRYDRPWFKILAADDGIYRIPYATLTAQGIPVENVAGAQFQLFRLGEEVPIYASTPGVFAVGDFIEFYGQRNRGELDRHLYRSPDAEMLNPLYSISTDTSAYFLTWADLGTPTLRYQSIANDLSNPPPKEEWFWHELRQVFGNAAIQKVDANQVAESSFDEGEGFARNFARTSSVNFQPRFIHPASVNSTFRLRLFSNNRPHDLRVSVNGTPFFAETFNGYRLHEVAFEKPAANHAATDTLVFNGAAGSNDQHALASASLTYPRSFDFGNQTVFPFRLAASEQARYLEISNFNAGNVPPVLYDINNQIRITTELNAGMVRVLLPPSAVPRDLLLVNANSGVRTVTMLRPVTFTDYSAADAEYIIISHPRLYDDGNGHNPVQAYADYRASQAGGGYRTVILDVEQLYDQFAYGIHRHPLSVRNAIHHFARQWSDPKYVLIIGKGRQYDVGRTAAAVAGTYYVPTFGVPGSDNLLIASNYTNVPVLPIGRIAASTPAEVKLYLDKVVQHESSFEAPEETERAWRKEVVHLGGGAVGGEQQFIRSALTQMENILRNNAFGANVQSFYKTNSDPIQQSVSEALTQRINDGVGVITFFGHSGSGGFDFSIDDPVTYRNTGRYPVIFSLGCYSGQIHTGERSVGESFIFQSNKGAIAFFASTGLGYISALNTYAQAYYNNLGGSRYGQGIGNIQQQCLRQLNNIGNQALLHQFTLHGDPALIITPFDKPDYLMRSAEATIEPRIVNAQLDSFEFRLTIRNIGKAVPDSCFIEITRQFPDGLELLSLRQRIPTPRFSQNHTFRLPVFGERAVGLNRLLVKIDADDEIAEGPIPDAEQNNTLRNMQGEEGLEFYVFANGVLPLYPPDFGIAGSSPVTLKASSADLFAPEQTYLFEIDTTLRFDSPALLRHSLVQNGGLLQWAPNHLWRDSTVYYWRISPDSVAGVGYTWRQSSFLYLAGSPEGWNQSHYFQFLENRLVNQQIPEQTRRLEYLDNLKTIRIKNAVFPNFPIGVDIDNVSHSFIEWDGPVNRGVYIFVLDSITADPWINLFPGQYGSRQPTTWAREHGHFPYWTNTPEWRQRAINFLKDTIPSGNYVILYTIQYANTSYMPEAWAADSLTLGTNLFQVLEDQGAQLIRSTAETGPKPYAIMYKKDDPSFPVRERLVELNEPLQEVVYINGRWDRGEMRSLHIGPAQSWGSLHRQITEDTPEDEWALTVYGIRPDSTEAVLIQNLTVPDTSLTGISSAEFPYLRLVFQSSDETFRTAPQLPFWRVLYEGLPDAVLNPSAQFSFHKDTLQQGEPLSLSVTVQNITTVGMDSLLVRFTITDPAGNRQITDRRFAPLPSNDHLNATLQADTRSLAGLQQLRIEVNPDRDQPELYTFNNTGIVDFYVEQDRRNPLLDVTFDGRRIMDGELVSAKPFISIMLRDENPWLRLDDTSLFKILLRAPGAPDVAAVPLDATYVRFIPAGSTPGADNRATIELTPHFEESGIYTLIVQGRDATGNTSGAVDYRINFEVITEARISNVLNYPNPFSTSTRFVYTLTGEEAPAFFVIRIMTISGRIVRELTQDDLGPLRIGTHQTDFAWDATDTYGDRLANGVYLYQIMAKDRNGKDLLKQDTGTNAFFKNGIGKLVILR